LAETTYNDVLSVGMCRRMRPVGESKKGEKKDRNFHASNWLFEYRPFPLTWPMAYTTACTTVQAVIEW